MRDPPTGTVTFLFTDIEGSTRLWEERPDEMRAALAEHDALVRAAIDAHGGYVFATGGDGFAAAFSRAADAVDAAREAQAALADHPLIRVRMGVHTGEVHERDGDYFGPAVNRAARIMAVAHGGQILASRTATELLSGQEVIDLGTHVLRDLSEPISLGQLGSASFPPLRSLTVLPNNLPAQLSEFIGRAADVDSVRAALARYRLVTLTGVGGVGKTRLALRVAAEGIGEFAGGVWFASLAPVSDETMIDNVVAQAIGLQALEGRSPREALRRHCAGRSLLVVLDNCEHMVDAVASLVEDLLHAAPSMRVLATSREALGVEGEHSWPVPSLSPDDAAALFIERARAVDPNFADDAGAVSELCTRLDGIPLAIELASGRVGSMSVAQITDRLHQRFRLLSRGRRTALGRQQTLQATIDWSYDRLEENERVVFCRLAAFAGSFDLDAAEAVAGAGDILSADVVDALAGLVAKSMVVTVRGSDTVRYRLLETLRQYALERLIERGEAEIVQQRHRAHYWSRAQHLAPCWEGRGDLDALAEFEQDVDEYRAAVERLIEESDFEGADQLDRQLSWGWALRYPAESFDRSLRIVEELIDPASAAARTAHLSGCAMNLGRAALIGGFARDAIAIAERAGNRPPLEALRMLAQDMWFREDWAGLFDVAEQYAQAAVVEGSPWHEAWALDYTVGANYSVGEIATARRLADDVVDRVAASGNHGLAQGVNMSHGFAEMWIDAARAVTLFEEARAHGPDRPTALSVYNEALLAVALAEVDRPFEGASVLADALRLADRMGASTSELLVLAAFVLAKCKRQFAAADTLALAELGLAGGAPLWNAARQARERIDASQLPPSAREVTLNEVVAMLTNAEG